MAQPSADGRPVETLRFGTTTVFLDDQVAFLSRWASYLTEALGMPVQFVRRRAYRDIMGMLRSQELDAAWICGYPWVVNRAQLRGLAMPMYHGEPWYQSYLIVPSKDQTTRSLRELRGRTYAFSDPDSNSGYLVPRTTLIREGIDPDRHFGRTFFTWGHRNVVSAVAAGLSDGGSVDGYVWDTLQRVAPTTVKRTRVAWRSDRYGFPPLVVRASLSADIERRLREALLGMSETDAGKRLLAELNLTSFGRFTPEVFDGIAQLVALAGARAS
ncbi:MAG TPA: PhnD/SsuA/transferrin family substrate-binding protein [Albitalea sp.]|uniref:substrate-binding domain-containing protein n=1 Tax=Piscinibacter sp. TaxID=1903157 RepID=UPI002ED1530A